MSASRFRSTEAVDEGGEARLRLLDLENMVFMVVNKANALIFLALIALVYHLGEWRPGQSKGAGFDEMMDVSVADWDKEVVGSRKPVLVFFHSPASAACQQIYPVLSDVHETFRGQLKVARVDLDANASLAMRHRIDGVPSLVVFQNGLLAETLGHEDAVSFNGLKGKLIAYCGDS